MADDSGSFEVNGKRYSLPTELTLGEMADAERYFGVEFGADQLASSIRMAAALVWIAIRREDATVTVEDVRGLPAAVFESFLGGDASPPDSASNGASEPSGEPSSNTGESPVDDLTSIGSPGWPTGSDSALLTSTN